jgi:hypothetical protein
MNRDNGQSQEAQRARQESEFIKRIADFARYIGPEYITDSDNPRSLCIIAADCLDKESGKHAMAHILVGNDRVGRCALRSMMEDNDAFSAQVHELCDNDGGNRSVEELDDEIGRKQKRLKCSIWVAVFDGVWSAVLIAMQVVGVANLLTTISGLLLMALCGMFITRDIQSLRRDLARLRQQRKRAAGRQKIMNRISQFGEFLRQMRAQIEEDAGDDDE